MSDYYAVGTIVARKLYDFRKVPVSWEISKKFEVVKTIKLRGGEGVYMIAPIGAKGNSYYELMVGGYYLANYDQYANWVLDFQHKQTLAALATEFK